MSQAYHFGLKCLPTESFDVRASHAERYRIIFLMFIIRIGAGCDLPYLFG